MKRSLSGTLPSVLLLPTLALLCGCGSVRGSGPAPAGPRPADAAPVRFTDATTEAGIDFRQRHGGCGKAYFVEQTGAGAALADLDGDGDLDLYFPQPTWLPGCKGEAPLQARLYLNDGRGRFTEAPGAGGAACPDYGIGVAAGDYDSDGREDLFVACYGRSRLFRNLGGARFKDVTAAARIDRRGYSTSAAWLDYDRDGHLDLFVCGYVEFDASMRVHCPSPAGKPDYCTPEAFTPARNALYRNNGDGTFRDVSQAAGLVKESRRALGVVAVDLDADGWTDLFVANDTSANMLYRNLGDGRFVDEAMERGVAYGAAGRAQSNMGIACGDYDRDGDPDVLVTTFASEPFTLYRNDGAAFTDVSAQTGLATATYLPLGFGTQFLDADRDGHLDLFFANGHVEQYVHERMEDQTFPQANQLFLGDGKGGFSERPAALPAEDVRVHRGLALGDIDGDGDQDVVLTCLDGRPVVLRNDTEGGHWLTVDVRDRRGSQSAVGTKVSVRTGGVTQTGWVLGGASYLCQSDYAPHFGLGAAGRVETVEITWLSGQKQVLRDVPADQRLVVRPPAGSTATGFPPSLQR
jgi:enediyne biosynthesis protein E4